MNGAEQVLAEIQHRERWLVTSHARPDGDAIGSALASAQVLRQMGKEVQVVMHDPVPRIYRSLPGASNILIANSVNCHFDGALILECDSVERTRLQGLDGLFLINIDHHNTSSSFANVNWIVPRAAATAELVYRLAILAGVHVTPEMASCLYMGLLTDTGAFCYVGTDAATFQLAQDLVRAGADPVAAAQSSYFKTPESKMRLLGRAIANMERDGELVWMHVTQDDLRKVSAIDEDCEGLANYPLGIEGVEVAIFFREMPDGRFRVSLRSKGRIDVAKVAEQFGGGGHAAASGHSADGPLEHARESVIAALRRQHPDCK